MSNRQERKAQKAARRMEIALLAERRLELRRVQAEAIHRALCTGFAMTSVWVDEACGIQQGPVLGRQDVYLHQPTT